MRMPCPRCGIQTRLTIRELRGFRRATLEELVSQALDGDLLAIYAVCHACGWTRETTLQVRISSERLSDLP